MGFFYSVVRLIGRHERLAAPGVQKRGATPDCSKNARDIDAVLRQETICLSIENILRGSKSLYSLLAPSDHV
jgi:hypothetical protein